MKVRRIDTSRTWPKLPDGRQPEKLRGHELFSALKMLGIPNVTSEMGKLALCDAYFGHVEAVAADLRAESTNAMRCTGLPEALAARAVELIARNAADAA